jgi:predicted enzyme related to lactoylglutathione lyase
MQNATKLSPPLTRVILYVKNVSNVAAFYQLHFNLRPLPGATPDWIELARSESGCTIALHRAAKTHASGAAIKLVFGVADIRAFKTAAEKNGLKFGAIHSPEGFEFANAKDPAGNSISISSRGLSAATENSYAV